MAEVSVTEVRADTFEVVIEEGSTSTTHEISVEPDDLEGFSDRVSGADLVEASVRFLLDREPKESILSHFGLRAISRYFPEYRDQIGNYL